MDRIYRHIDQQTQERVLLDNLMAWEREHLAQTLNRDAAPDAQNRAIAVERLRYLEQCMDVAEAVLAEVRAGAGTPDGADTVAQ